VRVKYWREITVAGENGAVKICRIAILLKIRSVESPFLPKVHSVELMIRRINLT